MILCRCGRERGVQGHDELHVVEVAVAHRADNYGACRTARLQCHLSGPHSRQCVAQVPPVEQELAPWPGHLGAQSAGAVTGFGAVSPKY